MVNAFFTADTNFGDQVLNSSVCLGQGDGSGVCLFFA